MIKVQFLKNKFEEGLKNMLKWKSLGSKVIFQLAVITMIASLQVVQAAPYGTSQYPELMKIVEFVKFIIGLIRWGASIVGGLIATTTGWTIMTNTNGGGVETAKKTFKMALIGLFLIFFGTTLANFIVDKFAQLLL